MFRRRTTLEKVTMEVSFERSDSDSGELRTMRLEVPDDLARIQVPLLRNGLTYVIPNIVDGIAYQCLPIPTCTKESLLIMLH